GSHNYTTSKFEQNSLVSAGWRNEGIAWYGVSAGVTLPPAPPSSGKSVQVDKEITGIGGQAYNNPGSYRLQYSNKAFDQAPSGSVTFEFSADVKMQGQGSIFEHQFVVAGNAVAGGQVGISLRYMNGNDADFAQGRIATQTINFPANSGTTGQQFYSVNTAAPRISNGSTVNLKVKYFDSGSVQTFVNGSLVGQYNTKLSGGAFIVHSFDENNVSSMTNIRVFKNGRDVTNSPLVAWSTGNPKVAAY
ncbi:MAG: hypothetical protein LBV67_11840, partial [Streptococcaceae bacterium]|nr:hypothetical protein [Streptococcaceae bacterium]